MRKTFSRALDIIICQFITRCNKSVVMQCYLYDTQLKWYCIVQNGIAQN